MARSAVDGRRLAGRQPWNRSPWVIVSTLAWRPSPARQLVGQLLGREDASVGAADDVERGALDLGPERGHAVFHHQDAVLPVEGADHGREHADVGHGPGDHQGGDPAGPEGSVQHGPVEAVVVVFAHHELVGARGQLRDDARARIALEAGRRGPAEAGRGARRGAPVLRVELADQERSGGRGGELGEAHRQALLAEDGEQLLDPRQRLAGRRYLHDLALFHEPALHVDDEERGAARLEGQGAGARLLPIHRRYQAETENAFGMCRIALTAPSSLKITETTSKRQETCRSRLSLREPWASLPSRCWLP